MGFIGLRVCVRGGTQVSKKKGTFFFRFFFAFGKKNIFERRAPGGQCEAPAAPIATWTMRMPSPCCASAFQAGKRPLGRGMDPQDRNGALKINCTKISNFPDGKSQLASPPTSPTRPQESQLVRKSRNAPPPRRDRHHELHILGPRALLPCPIPPS